MGKTGTMGDLDYMQSEVANLRKDLRMLRDKNHQLTEDNICLTEYIRDLEISRPPPVDDVHKKSEICLPFFHYLDKAKHKYISTVSQYHIIC